MRVEVFGDVLCPWCYIGKRRLEAALAKLPTGERDRVRIVWRSYELGEEGRTPGPTAAEQLTEMWGERAAERLALIVSQGAAAGVELNLHLARPVSTFDAHRLTQLAAADGLADAMLERLLRAYHTEGRNIADPQVLVALGAEAGLDPDLVRATLATDAYAEQVRDDQRRARALGVRGVPALVIDGAPPISGNQQPEALLRALTQPSVASS